MQPLPLNTQPLTTQNHALTACNAVAQSVIVLHLSEAQLLSMWETSVLHWIKTSTAAPAYKDMLEALATGCMQGHRQRILEDHCEPVYRGAKREGGAAMGSPLAKVEVAYRWRTSDSQGLVLFLDWQWAPGLAVPL